MSFVSCLFIITQFARLGEGGKKVWEEGEDISIFIDIFISKTVIFFRDLFRFEIIKISIQERNNTHI